MDVDLLKTFIEVYHTRHFARAADNLYITPSAVSARVRLLETQLGTPLFSRERNNIQLTEAGERFLGYARNMLRLWEQARYEMAMDADPRPNLRLLAVPGLWDGVGVDWMRDLWAQQPGLSLHIEAHGSSQITTRLQQNSADLGLMLEPTAGPELELVEMGQLQLAMVSTWPGLQPEEAMRDRYMLVDWNTSFHAQHANAFPNSPPPTIWVSTGRIAFDLLLATGGTAYLPRQMVANALQEHRLHLVTSAPEISLYAYAAYPVWSEKAKLVQEVLQIVRARLSPRSSTSQYDTD